MQIPRPNDCGYLSRDQKVKKERALYIWLQKHYHHHNRPLDLVFMLFHTLGAALIWSKKDGLKFRLEYSSNKQADITFCSIRECYICNTIFFFWPCRTACGILVS